MKLKEIQRKGDNIYTITYETYRWLKKVEVVRDVYVLYSSAKFVDDNTRVEIEDSIINIISHLKGNEPLKINQH